MLQRLKKREDGAGSKPSPQWKILTSARAPGGAWVFICVCLPRNLRVACAKSIVVSLMANRGAESILLCRADHFGSLFALRDRDKTPRRRKLMTTQPTNASSDRGDAARTDTSRVKMAWFEHNTSRIYFEEQGSGDPVL